MHKNLDTHLHTLFFTISFWFECFLQEVSVLVSRLNRMQAVLLLYFIGHFLFKQQSSGFAFAPTHTQLFAFCGCIIVTLESTTSLFWMQLFLFPLARFSLLRGSKNKKIITCVFCIASGLSVCPRMSVRVCVCVDLFKCIQNSCAYFEWWTSWLNLMLLEFMECSHAGQDAKKHGDDVCNLIFNIFISIETRCLVRVCVKVVSSSLFSLSKHCRTNWWQMWSFVRPFQTFDFFAFPIKFPPTHSQSSSSPICLCN